MKSKLTEFGKVLRKAQIDANLSNRDTAIGIGVSASHFFAILHGKTNVSDDLVVKLEDYFKKHGFFNLNLKRFVISSNKKIDISKLSTKHQDLIKDIYLANLEDDEIEKIKAILEQSKN